MDFFNFKKKINKILSKKILFAFLHDLFCTYEYWKI